MKINAPSFHFFLQASAKRRDALYLLEVDCVPASSSGYQHNGILTGILNSYRIHPENCSLSHGKRVFFIFSDVKLERKHLLGCSLGCRRVIYKLKEAIYYGLSHRIGNRFITILVPHIQIEKKSWPNLESLKLIYISRFSRASVSWCNPACLVFTFIPTTPTPLASRLRARTFCTAICCKFEIA